MKKNIMVETLGAAVLQDLDAFAKEAEQSRAAGWKHSSRAASVLSGSWQFEIACNFQIIHRLCSSMPKQHEMSMWFCNVWNHSKTINLSKLHEWHASNSARFVRAAGQSCECFPLRRFLKICLSLGQVVLCTNAESFNAQLDSNIRLFQQFGFFQKIGVFVIKSFVFGVFSSA